VDAKREGAASPLDDETTRAIRDSMSADAIFAPSGVETNRLIDICFACVL